MRVTVRAAAPRSGGASNRSASEPARGRVCGDRHTYYLLLRIN